MLRISSINLYLLILLFAFVVRIIGINLNPIGITHDELHGLINAKSIALTYQSAPGTIAGIFTDKNFCQGICVYGELVSYLLIPWMKIFPLSLIWSKIPFVIASIGIVFFAGKFFENITKNKNVGLLTSLLVAINPWAVHFGRTAFETLFSYLFYLASLYFFTRKNLQTKNLILGLVLAILGFLSYMGAKPLFPFIIIWGCCYYFYQAKFRNYKAVVVTLIVSFFLLIGYILILKNSPAGARLEEISFKPESGDTFESQVDYLRKVSLLVPFIRDISTNKYTVAESYYLNRYLTLLSPVYLFSKGEAIDVYAISSHSLMYLIDFPLIILGIITLGASLPLAFYILILIAVIPFPAVINSVSTTYALRAGLLFPLLCGLSALGIICLLKIKHNHLKNILVFFIVLFYSISFIYFLTMDWYRTPFEKSSAWFFHERVVSRYINLTKQKSGNRIILLAKTPLDFMYVYAFFSNEYTSSNNISEFNSNLKNKNLVFNNLALVRSCQDIPRVYQDNTTYIIEEGIDCKNILKPPTQISDPRDGGDKFLIINDQLCSKFSLSNFPYPRNILDFEVEKMNQKQFCETWISKLI